jgi:TetR/AcrR family transcriptional repressor of nem operon
MSKKSTRENILKKCFEAVEKQGFEALRTDKEIQNLNISKGAFYHYFPTKLDLGYALIEEIIKPKYEQKWSILLENESEIAWALHNLLEKEKATASEVLISRGDVLYNLMLEMSGVDSQFRLKLDEVLEIQVKLLQKALLMGKNNGQFKSGMDSRSMAYLLIGQLHGCYAIAKTRASKEVFISMVSALQRQLQEVLYAQDPSLFKQRALV